MHVPVMVGETIDVLITDPGGTYLDLNLGEGGHAEAICRSLGPGGRYVGVDLDPRAIAVAAARLAPFASRVTLLEGNQRDFPALLDEVGIDRVDGALFDLGLSTAQLDPVRGFAFDADGPLDMRYAREGRTAAELLASLGAEKLAEAFRRYGDLRNAPRLANAIVRERETARIETTSALVNLVERVSRPHPSRRRKVLSQVFQTLRVLVNDEVNAFAEALDACPARVAGGGVAAVLAYESVTDRIAKRFFRPADVPRDLYGNPLVPKRWELLTRRAVRASEAEISRNPAARSARLRAARRVGGEA